MSDSASTLRRVLAILGDRLVSALVSRTSPAQRQAYRKSEAPLLSAGDVRRTKAAFAWGVREGIIPQVAA